MDTRKKLNHSNMNTAAWGWEYKEKGKTYDGISVGLYPKPTKKKLAEPANAIAKLYSVNGELVCEVNMKTMKEQGVKLVLNDKE